MNILKLNFLQGKKTYIVAVATVVFAVAGVIVGQLSIKEAIELVLGGGALASLRKALE